MSEPAKRLSRRNFLVKGSATLGWLAAGPLSAQTREDVKAGRKVPHIIGHSHIDAAWLWPWRDVET